MRQLKKKQVTGMRRAEGQVSKRGDDSVAYPHGTSRN